MAKRELSKCRIWERERRDRLKNSFNALGKLLPCYDPSSTLSKIEILQKAATHITDLQNKVKELLSGASEGPQNQRAEIQKLEDRIEKLLIRNEQLTNLLQTAGIKVPTAIGTIQNFTQNKKFSHKITPEIAENLCKKLTKNGHNKKGPTKPKTDPKMAKNGPKIQKKKKKIVAPNENVDLNNKQKLQKKKKSSKINSTVASPEKQILAPQGPTLGPGALIFADGRVLPIARPLQAPPTALIPPIIAQNGIQRPQLVGSTLTTPNGLVATTFTTPSLTRPLLTTPIVATPTQPRPTTVILMRQRPMACKTKIPIPPLRKKILESPILGKNDSKIGGKCLKRRKVVAKKKLIGKKDLNKITKNFLDPKNLGSESVGPSSIAKLQETVKKIDIDSSNVTNGPELGSKNSKNGPKSDQNGPNLTQPQNIPPPQEESEKSKKSKIEVLKIENLPQNASKEQITESENFGPGGPQSENLGPCGPPRENLGSKEPQNANVPKGSKSENLGPKGPESENGPKVPKNEKLGPKGPQSANGPDIPINENLGLKGPQSGNFGPCGTQIQNLVPKGPQCENFGSSGPKIENFEFGGPKSDNFGPCDPLSENSKKLGPKGPQKANGPNVPKNEKLGPSDSHSENSENFGPRGSQSENLGPSGPKSDDFGPQSENFDPRSVSQSGPKSESVGPGVSQIKNVPEGPKSENLCPKGANGPQNGPSGPQSPKSEVPKSSPDENLTKNLPKVQKSPLSQNGTQNLVVLEEKLEKSPSNLNLGPKTDGNSIQMAPVKVGNETSTCLLENSTKPGVPIEKNPKIDFQFLENKELVVQTSFGDSPTKNLADSEVATHSELSNDIFATFSSGNQHTSGHPESLSPTAAFLLAFPLVSTLTGSSNTKNNEVSNGNEETCDSRQDTPTLLQIGTIDSTPKSASENLLNLDSFTFFGQGFDEKRPKTDRGQLDFIWSNLPKKLDIPKTYNLFSDQEKGFQNCGYESFHLETCGKDIQGKNMEVSGQKSSILQMEVGLGGTSMKTVDVPGEISIPVHLEPSTNQPSKNPQSKSLEIPKKPKSLHLETSKDLQSKKLEIPPSAISHLEPPSKVEHPEKTSRTQTVEKLVPQTKNTPVGESTSKTFGSQLEKDPKNLETSCPDSVQKTVFKNQKNISKIDEKVVQSPSTNSSLSKKVENLNSGNPEKSTLVPGKPSISNQKSEKAIGSAEKSAQSATVQCGDKNVPKMPFQSEKPPSGVSIGTPLSKLEEKRLEPFELDKDKKVSNRPPVNWMTTPDTRLNQIGENLPPLELGSIFGSHNWDYKTNEEDNRWSWSPGKLLPPLIGSQDHVFPVGTSELPPLPSLSDITQNFVPTLDLQSKSVESASKNNQGGSGIKFMEFGSSKDFQSPYLDHPTGSFKYPAISSSGENTKPTTSIYQSPSGTSRIPKEQVKRPCYLEDDSKTCNQNQNQNQQRKITKPDSGKKTLESSTFLELPKTVEGSSKLAPFSVELSRSGAKDTFIKTSKSESEIFHLEPNISDMHPYNAPLIGKGTVPTTTAICQPLKMENQFYHSPSISSKSLGQVSTSKSQPSKALESQYYHQATSIGNVPTSNIFGTSKTTGKISTANSQPSKAIEPQFYQSSPIGNIAASSIFEVPKTSQPFYQATSTSNIFGSSKAEGTSITSNTQSSKTLEPQFYQASTSIRNVPTSNIFASSKSDGKYSSSNSQPFYQTTSIGSIPNSNIFGTSGSTTGKTSTSDSQASKALPQFYQATSIGNIATSKGMGTSTSDSQPSKTLPQFYQATSIGNIATSKGMGTSTSDSQPSKALPQFYQATSIGNIATSKGMGTSTSDSQPSKALPQFYQATSIGNIATSKSMGTEFASKIQVLPPLYQSTADIFGNSDQQNISKNGVQVPKMENQFYQPSSNGGETPKSLENQFYQSSIGLSGPPTSCGGPTSKGVDQGPRQNSSCSKVDIKCTYTISNSGIGSKIQSSTYSIGSISAPNARNVLFGQNEQVNISMSHMTVPVALPTGKLKESSSLPLGHVDHGSFPKCSNLFQTQEMGSNFVPKLEQSKNFRGDSTQVQKTFQNQNLPKANYGPKLPQNLPPTSYPQKAPNFIQTEPNLYSKLEDFNYEPTNKTSNFAGKLENTAPSNYPISSTYSQNGNSSQKVYSQNLDQMTHFLPNKSSSSFPQKDPVPKVYPPMDKTSNFGSVSKSADNSTQKVYQSFQNKSGSQFVQKEDNFGTNTVPKTFGQMEHGSNAPKPYSSMENSSNSAPKCYPLMEHGTSNAPKIYSSMEHSSSSASKAYPSMENSSNSTPKGYPPMEHGSNVPKTYPSIENSSNSGQKGYPEHGSNAPKIYSSMEHSSSNAPKAYPSMENSSNSTPKGYPPMEHGSNVPKTYPSIENSSNSGQKGYPAMEHGSTSAPKTYPQIEHGSTAPKAYSSMEHGSNGAPRTYSQMEHRSNAPKAYPLMESSSNSTSKAYPPMEHSSNPAPKPYPPMEHAPFVPKVESSTPKGYQLEQMSFNQNKSNFDPKEELFSNPPSVSKPYHPLEHCSSNFQTVPKETAPKYQLETPNFDQNQKGAYNQKIQMWEGQMTYQDFPSSKNMEYSYGKFPIFTNSEMNTQTSTNPFGTPSNSGGNIPFRHSEAGQNLPISTLTPLEHGNLYPIGNIGTSTSLAIGDHSLGVPTTLPTLVGELGLGSGTNLEPESSRRASKRKNVQNIGQNYDLQSSNTFSVSHLVEPNGKDEGRSQGAKRNTSGKSVSNRQTKRKDCFRNQSQKWPESKRLKNSTSNSTNYSAEALISDSKYQQYTNSGTGTNQQFGTSSTSGNFHNDNQVSNQQSLYFQQQEVYPTFGTTYSGPFYPDDYPGEKDSRKAGQCQPKKSNRASKTRHHTPEIMTPYVDLSFLSMPGAISSPLLSEGPDFNAPSNVPPLYYSRPYGPNSPTTNSASGQLTSFNLSAIFPEIGTGKANYNLSGKNSTQPTSSNSTFIPTTFSNS